MERRSWSRVRGRALLLRPPLALSLALSFAFPLLLVLHEPIPQVLGIGGVVASARWLRIMFDHDMVRMVGMAAVADVVTTGL